MPILNVVVTCSRVGNSFACESRLVTCFVSADVLHANERYVLLSQRWWRSKVAGQRWKCLAGHRSRWCPDPILWRLAVLRHRAFRRLDLFLWLSQTHTGNLTRFLFLLFCDCGWTARWKTLNRKLLMPIQNPVSTSRCWIFPSWILSSGLGGISDQLLIRWFPIHFLNCAVRHTRPCWTRLSAAGRKRLTAARK